MMTTKMMKRTAITALVGVMSYGAVGAAEVSASALRTQPSAAMDTRAGLQQMGEQGYEMTQLRRDRDWDRDRRDRDRRDRDRRDRDRRDNSRSGKKYSRGSINTAIIAGAVIGAIIAKNT